MAQQPPILPVAAPLEQTFVSLTLGTAVVVGLVIFVTAFLLGLWCGWRWQQGRDR
jgi:hypothetical protein